VIRRSYRSAFSLAGVDTCAADSTQGQAVHGYYQKNAGLTPIT